MVSVQIGYVVNQFSLSETMGANESHNTQGRYLVTDTCLQFSQLFEIAQ